VECLIAYSGTAYRQLAIRQEETVRQRKQRRFLHKPLPVVALAIFTGLIVLLMILSAPVLVVFVLADNIQGTPRDDTLNGTPEADTINGFEGNDKLFGEGGDDTLDGGDGGDEIRGGDGNDEIKDVDDEPTINKVYGGSGDDNIDLGIDHTSDDYYYVYGEDGSDYIEVVSRAYIDGGRDDDTIYCTGFECQVGGNDGDDEIHVKLYDVGSNVHGGRGNDKVFGRGYAVNGGGGNDYLSLDGAETLKGGEGDDYLEGGTFYNGGPGADTFKCSSDNPYDTIEDYNPEEGDTIISPADCETVEDATPPDVEITQAVDKKGSEITDGGTTTNSRYIKITFEATEGEIGEIVSLECSLDGQAHTSCTSPVVYDKLKRGTHEFTVRALDANYRAGEDEFTWTIGKAAAAPPPR
jgi:RTX calcium-binding nonapeptide repeat (4 copies)